MKQRVLGIDPGSRITGYGIVDEIDGSLRAVAYGVIRMGLKTPFPVRLKEIYAGIEKVILKYDPTVAAVETLFFAKNVGSAIKLGQARGAAITAAVNYGLTVAEYSPTNVKKSVSGYGRAEKEQIQKLVYMMLGIRGDKKVPLDATDALSVAICHLSSSKMTDLLKRKAKDDRSITR